MKRRRDNERTSQHSNSPIFRADKDLAEVVALAHDIGHPPFGHVGEDVLDEIMRSFDGDYKHNTFSFKIVTSIENIVKNELPEFYVECIKNSNLKFYIRS